MVGKIKQTPVWLKNIIWVEAKMAKLESAFAVFMLLSIVVLVLMQIVYRYLLALPSPWTEEMGRYAWLILVFIGAGYTTYADDHIEINIIELILGKVKKKNKSDRFKKYFYLFKFFIMTIFCALYTVIIIPFIEKIFTIGQLSSSLRLPIWCLYLVFFLGLFCMTLHALIKFITGIIMYDPDDPVYGVGGNEG